MLDKDLIKKIEKDVAEAAKQAALRIKEKNGGEKR